MRFKSPGFQEPSHTRLARKYLGRQRDHKFSVISRQASRKAGVRAPLGTAALGGHILRGGDRPAGSRRRRSHRGCTSVAAAGDPGPRSRRGV